MGNTASSCTVLNAALYAIDVELYGIDENSGAHLKQRHFILPGQSVKLRFKKAAFVRLSGGLESERHLLMDWNISWDTPEALGLLLTRLHADERRERKRQCRFYVDVPIRLASTGDGKYQDKIKVFPSQVIRVTGIRDEGGSSRPHELPEQAPTPESSFAQANEDLSRQSQPHIRLQQV